MGSIYFLSLAKEQLMKENVSYMPLIELWEKYLRTEKNPTIREFGHFLTRAKSENFLIEGNHWLTPKREEHFQSNSKIHKFQHATPQASTLIWRLYKFIRIYTKPIIQQAGLASNDEFAILATLDTEMEFSKKTLIKENLIELTTGMDMIKRLVKQGLIIEQINKDDKREKLISISESGKKLLYTIYQKFSSTQDVLGNLNENERNELVKYLTALDTFHTAMVDN